MDGWKAGDRVFIKAKRLVLRRFCVENIPDLIELASNASMAAEVGEFQLELRLRESNFREGKWCDLLYYGILTDEWYGETAG